MSWNYRILRFKNDKYTWHGIHEVHYEEERPVMYSMNPARPTEESVEELKESLELMLGAFEKEVLDEDMFESEDKDNG